MSRELIQRLNATAESMRASAPRNSRVKNLAQQLDAAAEALHLYHQITGAAHVLETVTIQPGIAWQDVPDRSAAVFGEHSRGFCQYGVFTIKLRNCEPFLNTYQILLNNKYVSSNLSFYGAKEAALKHYERLQKIERAAIATDKAQFSSLGRTTAVTMHATIRNYSED